MKILYCFIFEVFSGDCQQSPNEEKCNKGCKDLLEEHGLKTGPGFDLRKNWPFGKTESQEIKTLLFVSSHIKDNVEVIRFRIKYSGVQGLIFVRIAFEKCTTNFYFENGEVGIKTKIGNL